MADEIETDGPCRTILDDASVAGSLKELAIGGGQVRIH